MLDVLCSLSPRRYSKSPSYNSIGYPNLAKVIELQELVPLQPVLTVLDSRLSSASDVVRKPEWVIFSNAPVAFRWTRKSLERARRVNGPNAVDLAILFLFSSTINGSSSYKYHGWPDW